jgi:hypothetical protein
VGKSDVDQRVSWLESFLSDETSKTVKKVFLSLPGGRRRLMGSFTETTHDSCA